MIPRKTLRIFRFESGEYQDGVWVEGGKNELFKSYSVQPTASQELELLPEGRNAEGSFTLFGDFPLKVSGADTNPDIVEIDGEPYEVLRVDIWQNQIRPHYRVIVSKVKNES